MPKYFILDKYFVGTYFICTLKVQEHFFGAFYSLQILE